MRLTAIKGPISDDLLCCICDLYGKGVDERYRDLAFVRTLFNENPFGYSYHVFALDGTRAVGCYSIVPMEVISRGTPLVAGKGEALFLLEEYRKVSSDGRSRSSMLVGLSLITSAHAFAAEQGLELLFALAPEALWPILRLTGFSKIRAQLKHRYFLLRPQIVRQLRHRPLKLVAACAVSVAQRTLFRLGTAFLPPRERIHVAAFEDSIVGPRLNEASSRHVVANDRWTVACTEKALLWWLRMGYVQLIAIDNDKNEYVLVSSGGRGGNLEILDWNLQGTDLVRALTILRYVIELANKHGAATISFANSPELTGTGVLDRAATLFGFLPWSVERIMFIKSPNQFHSEHHNVYFNWLFSI